MVATLKPLQLSALGADDFAELRGLRDEPEFLDWLWRKRASADGRHAWCAKCGKRRRFHRARSRSSFTCDSCGTHVHPTAHSLFQSSSTPLSTWFAAIEVLRNATATPPTARQLQIDLGIPYATTRRIRERILTELTKPRLPSLGDPSGESTTARVLQAASESIAERGYDGARVQDIAERAGVSSAAVLYHFDTRAKVLVAALEWATTRASRRRDAVLTGLHDRGSQLAALVAMSIPTSEVIRTELLVWNEYFARAARGELAGADAALASRYREPFERVIRAGIAEGVFAASALDVPELIEELLALLDGLAIATLVGRSWMPTERALNIVARFVRRELGADISPLIAEHVLDAKRP